MSLLTGRVALVTGAGQGIGRGVALAMAKAGADVVVVDIEKIANDDSENTTVVSEISAMRRRVIAIQADVSLKGDVDRMVSETMKQFGRLDILVCNAGVLSTSSVEDMSEQAWDRIHSINVKGTFLCCQRAIPEIRKSTSGSIINIASIAGKNGVAKLSAYCSSKFAVIGFTNSLAKELANEAITVNAICPGIIRTEMWDTITEGFKEPEQTHEDVWLNFIASMIPMGKPQTAADIGDLAVFLATARNITGQAMNVDGGAELH